ncbi:MAG: type II toxin-antitoxin system VapC family toxin [Caulobacteraceae bacterium]
MILVDSSVWIDYFRGASTPQADTLHALLATGLLAIGDLMLAEVLQGFDDDREFDLALRLLGSLTAVEIGGHDLAIQAARNFRALRAQGVTIRKTIDILIATRCIVDEHELLSSDRDFDPFVEHLGLQSARSVV